MSETIQLGIDDGIARVTLNRPDRYNALSPDMFQGLVDAGKRIISESAVRVVLLSGAGGNFCSGIDVQALASQGDPMALLAPSDDSPANLAQRAAYVWREVPVPVIAVLEGTVFGGGLQVALGADIRYAAPDSQLSVMEIKWGIIPDMSITQTLTRLVREDVARELTYSGRIVEAEEAQQLGLVTKVSDAPALLAEDMANAIVNRNPHAIRAAKALFTHQWHAGPEGLAEEERLQRGLLGTPNQMEAVYAQMQKREPNFED